MEGGYRIEPAEIRLWDASKDGKKIYFVISFSIIDI